MNIVAIGGGDVATGETAAIDRILLEASGKASPKLLFLPTASDDSMDYVWAVETGFGRLGAEVSPLLLWGGDADPKVAARKIDAADVIYVGGGNSKRMVARWRELGIDQALRAFLDSGRPTGGLSAGANCWFRVVNSDWPQQENIPGVNSAPLGCLGFVDLAFCPHTRDQDFRLAEFEAMMRDIPGAGIGMDDGCAIQIRGDEYRIVASQPGSQAHLLYSRNGEVSHTRIPPHDDFRRLDALKDGVVK